MKQKFYRYELWEDYQNGMYVNRNDDGHPVRVEQAKFLFTDPQQLKQAMEYVAFQWPISAAVNFTNTGINHQAWLGQAACCYKCGCGDLETIEAWHMLTDEQRATANAIADEVHEAWLKWYERNETTYQLDLFEDIA